MLFKEAFNLTEVEVYLQNRGIEYPAHNIY